MLVLARCPGSRDGLCQRESHQRPTAWLLLEHAPATGMASLCQRRLEKGARRMRISAVLPPQKPCARVVGKAGAASISCGSLARPPAADRWLVHRRLPADPAGCSPFQVTFELSLRSPPRCFKQFFFSKSDSCFFFSRHRRPSVRRPIISATMFCLRRRALWTSFIPGTVAARAIPRR